MTCLLLRPLQPVREVPQVTEKLKWVAAAKAQYDTIFIGSSRIRRHISPQVFDQTMKEHGVSTSSFNLGADGMTFPELSYVLKQYLEEVEGKLRYVIIDVNPLRRRMMKGSDLNSLREIHWHDLTHTAIAWKAVVSDFLNGEVKLQDTVRLLATHAVLLLRHYESTGKGAGMLPLRFDDDNRNDADRKFVRRGFLPVGGEMKADQRALYLPKLAAMRPIESRSTDRDAVLEEVMTAAAQEIREAGATPIFLLSPIVAEERVSRPLGGTDAAPVVLAFDDPVRYPELYRPEHRYDQQHLNVTGATLLTRMVAVEVARLEKSLRVR